jgi:hypothetical protein
MACFKLLQYLNGSPSQPCLVFPAAVRHLVVIAPNRPPHLASPSSSSHGRQSDESTMFTRPRTSMPVYATLSRAALSIATLARLPSLGFQLPAYPPAIDCWEHEVTRPKAAWVVPCIWVRKPCWFSRDRFLSLSLFSTFIVKSVVPYRSASTRSVLWRALRSSRQLASSPL